MYFVARGPNHENKTIPSPDLIYGHLSGPRVQQKDKRYLLPDPASLETAPYGTKVPFIHSQNSSLLKYAALDPDTWLGASFEAPGTDPPAEEKENKAELPTATSSGEESTSDAENDTGRTRAGRKIVPPSRLGY